MCTRNAIRGKQKENVANILVFLLHTVLSFLKAD